jgi:hypothetical protein
MSRALYWQSLYALGFSLFPLHPDSKTPALPEWEPCQTIRHDPAPWQDGAWNLAIATGAVSGVVVLDIDRPEAETWAVRQGLPDTLTVRTPRGKHRYYKHPGGRVANRANLMHGEPFGIDIRADGGYVVAPGSYYLPTPAEAAKGKAAGAYEWDWSTEIALAPAWLLALLTQPTIPLAPPAPTRSADETSAYGRAALEAECKHLTHAQPGEINDRINSSSFAVGQLVGGGEITDEDAREALLDALAELAVADEPKALGTFERGYAAGQTRPRAAAHEPDTAALGLPPVTEPVVPPPPNAQRVLTLTSEQAKNAKNHLTIEWWLQASGARIRYDEFSGLVRIGSEALTDELEREMFLAIRESSGLEFRKELYVDTLRNMAWRDRYHPVREYLDEVQPSWDGQARIDSWLSDYLGVPAAPYVSAVGSIFLTAAVRRIRQPGAKFDEMLVLEGPQGIDKSTAIAALSPHPAWFTDDLAAGMDSKEVLELTLGKWLVEIPELRGMGREAEHIKAMLSRQTDRARLSYGRSTTERDRQWVPFASTNDAKWLSDPTGNRRFWPVRVGKVDVEALRAVRGQLWAEAATREAGGASIRLPRELWAAAEEEQSARVLADTLTDRLRDVLGDRTGRVRGYDLMMACQIPIERHPRSLRRLGDAMRELGWDNTKIMVHGERARYYVKGDAARQISWMGGNFEYAPVEISGVK